jgi:hypothetical protein
VKIPASRPGSDSAREGEAPEPARAEGGREPGPSLTLSTLGWSAGQTKRPFPLVSLADLERARNFDLGLNLGRCTLKPMAETARANPLEVLIWRLDPLKKIDFSMYFLCFLIFRQ